MQEEIINIAKNINVQFKKDGKLTAKSLRKFQNKVDWNYISKYQTLSEDFIREFQDRVDWYYISEYQTLSEDFIREFQDKINWYYISEYQTLSEDFIREFQYKVNWYQISEYQTLSEDFIREFQDKVDWYQISEYQTLSEDFIREFQDRVDWYLISKYQKLSKAFRKEFGIEILDIFGIEILDTCWLYKPVNFKLKYIKENTNYKVIDDKYIEAYKTVKSNMESVFKRGFVYEVGKTYTAHCDCNIDEDNSFGLSAWTKKKALEYHSRGKLLKVLIPIKDIGAIVYNNGKIRTKSLEVISILNKGLYDNS